MPRSRLFLALVLPLVVATVSSATDPAKIGDRIGPLKFTDIRYLPRTLDDFGPRKAFVLVFTNASCPLAERYLPILQGLAHDYASKEVQFLSLNAAEEDSIVALATQAVQHEVEFPFVKDAGGACAKAVGVRRTPEAVILDGDRHLRYRGRIDDQYRLGGSRAAASKHELKDALDAVLAGRPVAVTETEVDGCPITFPEPRKPRDVTFAEHVAPILKKNCWQCHRPGGSGPFSLTTYKQASSRAEALADVVSDGRMPPWFASPDFGPFVNRRGLSDDERQTLLDWVRSGRALGDAAKVTEPPAPPKKWPLGEPDLILESGVYELPAAGEIPYKNGILPHLFAQDTWIQSVQIVPDNPRVLHHCNLAFGSLASGVTEENFITGLVPGNETMALDDGIAFRIPKGSFLGLQMHYVATGKAERCKITVGLRFPRKTVQKQLRHIQLTDHFFAIPPGAPAHRVSASRTLDRDVIGVGLFAHMHLRGKDMTFTAHTPDDKTETLLVIPNYSFSWQVPYRWEPGQKRFPKGTRIDCVAHFDNSAFNVYNPDPKATVRFGLQTRSEMMYGFFFYLDAAEKLGLEVDAKTGVGKR